MKNNGQRMKTVRALLDVESTLSLATGLPKSGIGVCSLFYIVRDPLLLYWFSAESSRHSVDLASSGQVAIAVHHATERWREIRGAQMRGEARMVKDAQLRKDVTEQYASRYELGRLLRLGLERIELYEFTPVWVRYIDNSRHFGYKFELNLQREA